MKEQIRAWAHETGFDAIGFTTVEHFPDVAKKIEHWVRTGRHGTMKYLERFRERQERLLAKVPGAKTVICLGVNYYQGPEEDKPSTGGPWGRVARYAWGRDYHEVISERLNQLGHKIKEVVGSEFCFTSCVDIGALPEKFLAQQAGLGFRGKHTVLISPEFGPWLLLGELVTNLDLEPDLPFQGDCGNCSLCREACPTKAIDADGYLNASRCISYLTTQHKGDIPEAFRSQLGDWRLGCDECLRVCPFTAIAKMTRHKEFLQESGQGPWIPF